MQAAEDQVGIGDGCAFAAAVAGGAGIGSGGLRAHLQRAGRVHPCQGAAARAGGVDVEHGHAHGQSSDLAFDGRRAARAVASSSATSVEVPPMSKAEDAIDARSAGHAERADHAPGRTGEDGAHGLARGRLRRRECRRRIA